MLRKGVYSYEFMNEWEKFNEAALPEKGEFCSHLNMEDITDADYVHGKRVCKDFEIKNVGEYHVFILKVIHYFWLMFLKTLEKCV